MRAGIVVRSLMFAVVLLAFSHGAFGQIGISVGFGPPLLPIYEQPILPGDGYLWAPGYWGYDSSANDYYWVPGTWVYPPQAGFLWTPGYWGWGGGGYYFNQGYWGPTVGYYGGINYGYGYGGYGYEGGRWEGNHFVYNTSVNRVNTAVVHNTYTAPVSHASENHVSYNGGSGGVEARPTAQQEAFAKEQHVGPVEAQTQHRQAARSNPELFASVTTANRRSRLLPSRATLRLVLWLPNKRAENTKLLSRMLRAPMCRMAARSITRANCRLTTSRRRIPAARKATRVISNK